MRGSCPSARCWSRCRSGTPSRAADAPGCCARRRSDRFRRWCWRSSPAPRWRMRSTPSSSTTASAIESTVSAAVNLRLRRLLMASARITRSLRRACVPVALISANSMLRSNSGARDASWLTKISAACSRAHSRNSRSMNAARRSASSEEVGSSAITSSGAPIKRPRRGHALLLPDAELGDRAAQNVRRRPCPGARAGARPPPRRSRPRARCALRRCENPHGRAYVLHHGQVGNEVEHLEDEADVVGAEAVPLGAPSDADVAARGPVRCPRAA